MTGWADGMKPEINDMTPAELEVYLQDRREKAQNLEQRGHLDMQTVRSLILINGGGAVALLSVFAAIAGKLDTPGLRSFVAALLIGVILFMGGLLTAVLNNHYMRVCSLHNALKRPRVDSWFFDPEPPVCHRAHYCRYFSMGFFMAGGITVAIGGFLMLKAG